MLGATALRSAANHGGAGAGDGVIGSAGKNGVRSRRRRLLEGLVLVDFWPRWRYHASAPSDSRAMSSFRLVCTVELHSHSAAEPVSHCCGGTLGPFPTMRPLPVLGAASSALAGSPLMPRHAGTGVRRRCRLPPLPASSEAIQRHRAVRASLRRQPSGVGAAAPSPSHRRLRRQAPRRSAHSSATSGVDAGSQISRSIFRVTLNSRYIRSFSSTRNAV